MRVPGGTIQCPHCPEKFKRPNGLTRHLGQQHGINARKRPAVPSDKKKRGRLRKDTSLTLGAAVSENGAKATAVRLLGQLRESRLKLDQRIRSVQELVEVL